MTYLQHVPCFSSIFLQRKLCPWKKLPCITSWSYHWWRRIWSQEDSTSLQNLDQPLFPNPMNRILDRRRLLDPRMESEKCKVHSFFLSAVIPLLLLHPPFLNLLNSPLVGLTPLPSLKDLVILYLFLLLTVIIPPLLSITTMTTIPMELSPIWLAFLVAITMHWSLNAFWWTWL